MTDSSHTTLYPSPERAGEDELVISWKIKDRNFIHRIQDYFGMGRYMSVNYTSPIKISSDDPKYPVLFEGEQKGFYRILKFPNVSKS